MRKYKRIIFLIVCLLFLVGCNENQNDSYTEKGGQNSISYRIDETNIVFYGRGYLSAKDVKEAVREVDGEKYSVTIEAGITGISASAFAYQYNLKNITIADSVKSIEREAFSNCSSLKKIEMSNEVIDIGEEAFAECKNLTNMEIPDSVTSIGQGAFAGIGEQFKLIVPAGSYAESYAKANDIAYE